MCSPGQPWWPRLVAGASDVHLEASSSGSGQTRVASATSPCRWRLIQHNQVCGSRHNTVQDGGTKNGVLRDKGLSKLCPCFPPVSTEKLYRETLQRNIKERYMTANKTVSASNCRKLKARRAANHVQATRNRGQKGGRVQSTRLSNSTPIRLPRLSNPLPSSSSASCRE